MSAAALDKAFHDALTAKAAVGIVSTCPGISTQCDEVLQGMGTEILERAVAVTQGTRQVVAGDRRWRSTTCRRTAQSRRSDSGHLHRGGGPSWCAPAC